MPSLISKEWHALTAAARRLDRQTVVVLIGSVLLIFLQLSVGSRRFFREQLAGAFDESWVGLLGWGWWFGMQGVTGFVLPVFILWAVFKRKPAEIGLGLGDWRLGVKLALLYLPLVAIGTWVLSDDPGFQLQYPHLRQAADDWLIFVLYEALFVFYWVGWEYLWRGFVLFGTAHTFGVYAIFVQMVPFAILHADKPPAEAVLSVLGGIALGAVVWRCRSFWIAVPIHAVQMLLIDLFCTLRFRTGAAGIGLDALWKLVQP